MKIKVYTDGSCSHKNGTGSGGWAVVFNADVECKIISGNEEDTTNNRMELRALIEAYNYIAEEYCSQEHVIELFSDSAYVVNSVKNGWLEVWLRNGWKTTKDEDVKNKDLWMEFLECKKLLDKKNVYVRLIKVKGHSGNEFNELVDRIAKEQSKKVKQNKKQKKGDD